MIDGGYEERGFSNKFIDSHIELVRNNIDNIIKKIIKNLEYHDNLCSSKGFKDGKDSFIYNIRSMVSLIYDKKVKGIEISWKDAITISCLLDISNGLFNEIIIDKELDKLFIGTNCTSDKTKALYNTYLINTIIPLDDETKPLFDIDLYDSDKYYHAMIEGISVFRTLPNPKFESDVGYRFPVTLWKKEGGVFNLWITGEFEQPLGNSIDIYEKNLHLFIRNYISNLHSMIEHPEVELVEKKYYNNQARINRGQIAIPTKSYVNLTGKLKKYITETITDNEKAWTLGHRFWVRGHWMEFKDERYKNMRGEKRWILPYIKGTGELISKEYYVGEKEQCWENQKQMIKIVQSIFPSNKISKNNRSILDGLEIDCYLPELKLGFEYNGQQHYEWITAFHKTEDEFNAQKSRDIKKNELALQKGIKLITIRYDEPLTIEHIREKLI